MALATILSIAPSAMWAFTLGTLLATHQSDRPSRWRPLATIFVSVWLTFCTAHLWRHPAIEPLWLQCLLLIALPGAAGLTIASIVERFRATRSAPPTVDTHSAPEDTAEGGIR